MIDTSLDSSNFYFLIACLQGVLLAGIILFKKQRIRAHAYLGILIFLFSLSLLHLVLEESIHAFNSKFPIPMDFGFAFGPLAYLHVMEIKYPSQRQNLRNLLLFLPSLIFDVVLFTGLGLYARENMDWVYKNIPEIQRAALITMIIAVLHLSLYAFLIIKETKSGASYLKDFLKIKSWLNKIVYAFMGIVGFFAIAIPIGLYYIEELDENSHFVYKPLGIILSSLIYWLGYFYLLRYQESVSIYIEKVLKLNASGTNVDEKKVAITNLLEQNHLYLDRSLTVGKVANMLGWPRAEVSATISEAFTTNFNDLINQYRVEAFKQLALQPESSKYSIQGLATESGFSSKASFYRAFKKETGSSPTEYLSQKSA